MGSAGIRISIDGSGSNIENNEIAGGD